MQVHQPQGKSKYRIADFALPGNAGVHKATFVAGGGSCKLNCICGKFHQTQSIKCSRCSQYVHHCIVSNEKNEKEWECLHCQSLYLDPIFSVEEILIETMFFTEYVYQYANQMEF